jgi:hypothetical protein
MNATVFARSRIALTLLVPSLLSACGAEGEGSIHVGRTPVSKVMVMPSRKPGAPPKAQIRRFPTTPKARPTRR